MGKLIISRHKEWQNRGRKFGVYIDGEKVDELVYLVIPLFLVYLYYLTLGRKKYIEIKDL